LNAKHRAKLEHERRLKKQLGVLEYERQKAEKSLNEKAQERAFQIVDKHTDLAIKATNEVIRIVLAYVLNKEFNFGATRIERVFKGMDFQMECVQSGHVSGDDLKQWCVDNNIKI
jgi:DNA topoisomerase VI subunit B